MPPVRPAGGNPEAPAERYISTTFRFDAPGLPPIPRILTGDALKTAVEEQNKAYLDDAFKGIPPVSKPKPSNAPATEATEATEAGKPRKPGKPRKLSKPRKPSKSTRTLSKLIGGKPVLVLASQARRKKKEHDD